MKIGLIGNQNSGKTTLFNCLTGMNAKIGNWPGVTIEKKTGNIRGTKHEIIDLPGIYSLSPYTIEEEVSRKFIFEEKLDVIINIVDATSIERSLYLTTQLLELDCKIIVALNMVDKLEEKGLKIDIRKLEEKLGVRICQISALKEIGIQELIKEIDKNNNFRKPQIFDSNLEQAINQKMLELNSKMLHQKFTSVKILEREDEEIEETIATERYDFIEKVVNECVSRKKVNENMSEKLDKIFLNKWFAFPIFIVIMFLVYYLSVGVVGSFTVDWIGEKIEIFGEWSRNILENYGTSEYIISLITDGIISGVGAVLGFIPQLTILFLSISILETSGYMSRIALLLDKLFRKIGLSGKSLIPFIIGSGCSVPGIMGTRIIENEDERKMLAILTPFIPCSAKLPIITLFAGYFFPQTSGLIAVSLYFLAITLIIVSALFMKKFIFKNTSNTYISELPEYKLPSLKYVSKDVFDKVVAFIKRAGTIILVCSIIIWFLLSFSFEMEYGVEIEKSMLATIGNKISWVFKPILGTDSWGATVSAIQGLVAKEQVVSSMAVINGLADNIEEGSQIFNNNGIFGFFSQASAYAFIVFNLFSAPCIGAIGAMKKELGSMKSLLKAVVFQIGIAWILATAIYQVGSRIENGILNFGNITVLAILISIIILVIYTKLEKNNLECKNCIFCNSCKRGCE